MYTWDIMELPKPMGFHTQVDPAAPPNFGIVHRLTGAWKYDNSHDKAVVEATCAVCTMRASHEISVQTLEKADSPHTVMFTEVKIAVKALTELHVMHWNAHKYD